MGVASYTTQVYTVNTPGFYINYKYGTGTSPAKSFMPQDVSEL